MGDSWQTEERKENILGNTGAEQVASAQSGIKECVHQTMSSKVSKRTIAIIAVSVAIIGVVLGVAGVVVCFGKDSEVKNLESQIAEKDAVITGFQDATAKCQDGQDAGKESSVAENGGTNKAMLLNLDVGKCLNCEVSDRWLITSGEVGFTSKLFYIRANADAVTATFVSWDALNEYFDYVNAAKKGKEYDIAVDVSGRVADIFVSSFGNGLGYETIFFLMEDGTVEYTPIIKATREGVFRSYGKVPDVENIVKFYTVNNYGGNRVLAQRADGDYYDLSDILLDTGNYDY